MRKRRASIFSAMILWFAAQFWGAGAGARQPLSAPKPKIRAITAFVNVDRTRYQIDFSEAASFLRKAKLTYERSGYTVQTLRIATQPFAEYTAGLSRDEALRFFKNLDGIAQQEKFI